MSMKIMGDPRAVTHIRTCTQSKTILENPKWEIS